MKSSRTIPVRLIQFIVFLVLFGLIALSVIKEWAWVSAFDQAVQSTAFSLRSSLLSAVLIPLTYSGNWQGVTAVCVLFLLIPKTRTWFGLPLTGQFDVTEHLFETTGEVTDLNTFCADGEPYACADKSEQQEEVPQEAVDGANNVF